MTTTQADGRFLHGILFLLIMAALASGAVAGIAMVKAQPFTAIAAQP